MILPARWTKLKYHKEQQRLWSSKARFRVVVAGRRSGKTEFGKRYLVDEAITTDRPDAWFVAAAPVHDQAKRIFWEDLKKLVPSEMIVDTSGHGSGSKLKISESELTIWLKNGAMITVLGMDRPERIEGRILDGIIMDEYANMKADVWTKNVRPALDTLDRPGWAWFTGVPEGRNHYYNLFRKAKKLKDWDTFYWKSESILTPEAIAAAKADMDLLTYKQEYEADFVDFSGRTYYPFKEEIHAAEQLQYLAGLPLILTFDFNTSPGTANVLQEQHYIGKNPLVVRDFTFTAVIDEVWIESNSNTELVCDEIISRYRNHPGEVYATGDATGAAGGTAKVKGSDWDIIRSKLEPIFGSRYSQISRGSNTREKVRVNSVNKRLQRADGVVSMLIDFERCPKTVEDYASVRNKMDGSGEIDKEYNPEITHLTDGHGYYITEQWPYESEGLMISQG